MVMMTLRRPLRGPLRELLYESSPHHDTTRPQRFSQPGGHVPETASGQRSLASIELFKGLPSSEIEAIEKLVRWRTYKAGEQILDKASDNRDAFLVVDGSVRVVNFSRSGREVAYAVVPTSGFFGDEFGELVRRMGWSRIPEYTGVWSGASI